MKTALFDHFPPRKSRAHEVTGAGATTFAAIICGLNDGGAIWVSENWQSEQLNPAGLAPFCDPAKLILARGKDMVEVLATTEEALRSGAVATVVAEISKPLSLTAGRRLQLAAEAGKSTAICVISEGMGNNAAETRWHCAPEFDPNIDAFDSTPQRWTLKKNKSGTLSEWEVRWDAETRRVIVVSEAGE